MDGVNEIAGEMPNSTWYHVNDGFFYVASTSDKNRVYLKCKSSKCKSRASMPLRTVERSKETFKVFSAHSHNPDFLQEKLLCLKRGILKRCAEEVTPFLEIWNEEIAKIDCQSMAELAGRISLNRLRSSMYRARTKNLPRIPLTLSEYGTAIQTSQKFQKTLRGDEFYLTTLQSDEGGVNIIFGSPDFIRRLPEVDELHLDGTFKVRPTVPPSRQLLTVMSMHLSHAFPVFFILMERKNEAAYTDVLQYIKSRVPQLNPSVFITDFEKALQKSLVKEFPGKDVVGCWFHSSTDMRKKANKFGLTPFIRENPMAKKVLKMTMALPLLPAEKIMDGYNAIKAFASANLLDGTMDRYLQYVHDTWIQGVGSARLSVYKQKRRTNNHQESFHNTLRHTMKGPHPNIWVFTDSLQKTENYHHHKYISILHGQAGSRPRSRHNLLQDRRVTNATELLDRGDATVIEFLQIAAHTIENVANIEGENDEEDDVVDFFERDENLDNIEDIQPEGVQMIADDDRVEDDNPDRNDEEPIVIEDNEVRDTDDDEPDLAAQVNAREMELRRQVDERLEGYRDAVKICLPISYLDVPTRDFVNRQVQNLQLDLTPEEDVVQINSDSPDCIFCTENASTRMIAPCGHWMGCINCTKKWVSELRCHQVTSADGNIIHMPDYPLPVQCPRCNALVGKLLRTYPF